jgi:hypothetical protein
VITIPDNRSIYFDVDDTLVTWVPNGTEPPKDAVQINDGWYVPHKKHIHWLKMHGGQRGSTVVVWSQGGSLWAEQVVCALGLEQYVTLCITKPDAYFDDLDCSAFMTNRVFLKD